MTNCKTGLACRDAQTAPVIWFARLAIPFLILDLTFCCCIFPFLCPCLFPNKQPTDSSFATPIFKFGLSDAVTQTISSVCGITDGVTEALLALQDSAPLKVHSTPVQLSVMFCHFSQTSPLATCTVPQSAICNFCKLLTFLFITPNNFSFWKVCISFLNGHICKRENRSFMLWF